MTTFDRALEYTFKNEGGFSNDAHDRGGATRFGITHEEASRWCHRPVSIEEMKEFPLEQAKAIYEAWYWKPLGCDRVNSPGIAICFFDIGVVRGIGVPPRYAQLICNRLGSVLAVDGHMGPKTLAAINGLQSPAEFIHQFAVMTESGFRAIVAANPTQKVFERGWVARAHRLLTLIEN